MLQARPGAFARLGQGGADRGGFLHSSRYDFNDGVIPLGAGFLAALAARDADRSLIAAMFDLAAAFAPDYAQAREKFQAAAAARSLPLERHVHPPRPGIQGEPLSMDVALLGDADAPTMLLLTSGMHGVEGFCGYGCQVALLHDEALTGRWPRVVSPSCSCHAVNPYGFSHLRRGNEDNVDVNRNFRDFRQPLAQNSAYASLACNTRPGRLAAEPRQYRGARCQCRASRTVQVAGDHHRRTKRIRRWALLHGARRPGATPRCAACWSARESAARGWAGSTSIPASARGRTARRSTRVRTTRRRWRARGVVRHRRHDLLRGTSTSADLTGVASRAAIERAPLRVRRHRTRVRHGTARRDAPGVARGAVAGGPAGGGAVAWRNQAGGARRVPRRRDEWHGMVYGQARAAVLQAVRGFAAEP